MGAAAQRDALRRAGHGRGRRAAARPDAAGGAPRRDAHARRAGTAPALLRGRGGAARRSSGARSSRSGVELIDAPQPGGDLEVVALADAALRAVGVARCTLDLGHAARARARRSAALGLDDEATSGPAPTRCAKNGAAPSRGAGGARRDRPTAASALPRCRRCTAAPRCSTRARALVDDAATHAALDELGACARASAQLGPASAAHHRSRRGARLRLLHRHPLRRLRRRRRRRAGLGRPLRRLIERYGRPRAPPASRVDVDRVAELLKLRGVPAPRRVGRRARRRRAGRGGPAVAPTLRAARRARGARSRRAGRRPTPERAAGARQHVSCRGSRRRIADRHDRNPVARRIGAHLG